MSRRRWAAAGAVVLAAGVALAFTVFRDDESASAQLRALQQDPLGRYVPRNGRLVKAYANNEDPGGMFSKPSEAKLLRLFAVPSDAGPAALQEAIDAASASGWTVEPPIADLGSAGSKQLSTGKATMSVGLITDPRALPEKTPGPVLSIALQHIR